MPSAFKYSKCHPNCCHSLHQVILTECTVILTKWLSILTILFVNNDTRTFYSDGTDMFIDINTYFEGWSTDLSKLQVFAGNPLCGAVCTNCLRNAHTSLQTSLQNLLENSEGTLSWQIDCAFAVFPRSLLMHHHKMLAVLLYCHS